MEVISSDMRPVRRHRNKLEQKRYEQCQNSVNHLPTTHFFFFFWEMSNTAVLQPDEHLRDPQRPVIIQKCL